MLFADTGLSDARISALFAVWSATAILAEVPSGAWADRYSRRSALVAAGVLQAAGYVLWLVLPGFFGFAAGFVLWGIGGAFASGSFEALVYDGLEAAGAADRYATVIGRTEAASLAVQVPVAVAATALFAWGGYALVGWVSVGCCLAAALLATRLPDATQNTREAGYLATLRAGIAEATRTSSVRVAVLAVAALAGLNGLEEYFALLARDWGVAPRVIPLALIAVSLVGAIGSALGGWGSRLPPAGVTLGLAMASVAFGAAALARHPAGLVGITLSYGLYQLGLVVADARLQARIKGSARATVTSVTGLGGEVVAIALFVAWAVGGVTLVAAIALAVSATLSRWLKPAELRRGRWTSGSARWGG